MIKYIVEKDGKFYLKRWIGVGTEIWDANYKGGFWWFIYKEYGTGFNSKQELIDAYRNTKSKFRGFL